MNKKIIAIFTFLLVSLSANAYIDNQYMTTPQYLQNTGYSKEMSRLMAVTNQDPYREPYVERNTFKNVLKRSYSYIAPSTFTDIDFYGHNITLDSPSWKDF